MASVTRKRRRLEKHTSPDEVARQPSPEQESHQSKASELMGRMLIHSFKPKHRRPVDFQADLKDVDGRYVIQNVTKDGLAYSASFRDNDELFQVNGTDVQNWGITRILHLLRTFHGYDAPQLMLAVERKPEIAGEPSLYIWVIFKVVWKDKAPMINVIQTQTNDTVDMPFIDLGGSFSWRGPPIRALDVYTDDGTAQRYLTVVGDGMEFTSYGANSAFYGYYYLGAPPTSGVVVASSLQLFKGRYKPRPRTTVAVTTENTVQPVDFPMYMVGSDIQTDPRLWYQKAFNNGWSLESLHNKGMYLGTDPNGGVMLSKTPTEIQIREQQDTVRSSEEKRQRPV